MVLSHTFFYGFGRHGENLPTRFNLGVLFLDTDTYVQGFKTIDANNTQKKIILYQL